MTAASRSASALFVAMPVALVVAACGPPGGYIVTRTVGGEAREGAYVSPYAYEHFIRGELANLSGNLREASDHYSLARSGAEDDPLLIARIADVTDRLGHEQQALELLDEGESLDAESELVWMTRGAIHERHDRAVEAIEAYARAASVAPRSELGPVALARMLRDNERSEEANAVLERYLERTDNRGAGAARARLALAIEQGDPVGAQEAVRALLEVAPARADEVRAAVESALLGGHPIIARRLSAALPNLPEHRVLRLRTALAAGDRDGAEAILARWMPTAPAELLRVAAGYLDIDRPERAAELARVAMTSEGSADARLILGRALRAMGRFGEAAETLATIHDATHAWPAAPIALARTLEDAGHPGLAADVLGRARMRRDSSALRLAHAEARARAGNESGALAALQGDRIDVASARAELLERIGRPADAADAFAALPVDDPALSDRVRARAMAERRRAYDAASAAETLTEWVEAHPADLHSRVRLAELTAEAGARDEAQRLAGAVLPFVTDAALRRRLQAIGAGVASPPVNAPLNTPAPTAIRLKTQAACIGDINSPLR